MNELRASLPCSCGRSVVARAKDAGGSIACVCGDLIAVPKLSDLRVLAGADAFVTNPAEAILKLQREGIEPGGNKCLLCGAASPVFYRCHAVCEQSHVKKTGESKSTEMLRWLILPFIANLLLSFSREDEKIDRLGHDISISFNLPVCERCTRIAGKVTRPAVAKGLMLRVPVYKALLEYYPAIELSVEQG